MIRRGAGARDRESECSLPLEEECCIVPTTPTLPRCRRWHQRTLVITILEVQTHAAISFEGIYLLPLPILRLPTSSPFLVRLSGTLLLFIHHTQIDVGKAV